MGGGYLGLDRQVSFPQSLLHLFGDDESLTSPLPVVRQVEDQVEQAPMKTDTGSPESCGSLLGGESPCHHFFNKALEDWVSGELFW